MKLKIDVVGLSYSPNRDRVVYEIGRIIYDKLQDVRRGLHVVLITDEKGGDKYASRAATSLRRYGIEPTSIERIDPVDCPYSCICVNGRPECGGVAEHEVYAAPCVCHGGDWLLMAKCCCGSFRQGVCVDFSEPAGCRCIRGEDVAECFVLFKCPERTSGSRT